MDKGFNYAGLFEQALGRIKSIRDPHATRPETADLRWNDVAGQVIFDFIENDLNKYYNVSQSANNISTSCLCFMITELMKAYDYSVQKINVKEAEGLAKAYLYLLDKKSNTLFLFKGLEEYALWKSNANEPKEVQDIMDSCGAKNCTLVWKNINASKKP